MQKIILQFMFNKSMTREVADVKTVYNSSLFFVRTFPDYTIDPDLVISACLRR